MDAKREPTAVRSPTASRLAWLVLLAACSLPAGAAGAPEPAAVAEGIHREVNRAREREGLPALAWHAPLAKIAEQHSADMAERDYFAHTSPDGHTMRDRYARAGYECAQRHGGKTHLGAENIALHTLYERVIIDSAGQREYEWLEAAALARKVVDGWMQSAGHRQNILAPQWQREGIGLAVNADYEALITQNFC